MTSIAAVGTSPTRTRDRLAIATEALFLAGVVLLPMMQFGAVDALGTRIIPSDVCFGLAVAGAAVVELRRRGAGLRGPFPIVVGCYLAALAIAAVASPDHRESFERIVIDGYCVVLGTTAFVIAREASARSRIAWAWILGSAVTVVAALLGIVLFLLGATTPSENFAIGDLGSIHTSVPRVVGFFLNSNLFCNYLVVGLLFTLGMLGWRRPLGLVVSGATGVALAFTLSPGLGGAVVAVTLWLLVSERGWSARVRGSVVAAGVVGGGLFLVLTVTVGPRGHTWADSIDTLMSHPLVGVGPGLPVAATTYEGRFFTDAHNAWLNVGGQAGFLGLLALVAVVVTICGLAWRARPIGGLPEPVRSGWCAFVGAVLFGSLSLSLEQARHVWVLMGFLAAGLAASHGARRT
jgi:O-antigen ligase